MATRDNAEDTLVSFWGQRTDLKTSGDTLTMLLFAQADLESRGYLPSFLIQKKEGAGDSFQTAANTQTVSMPTGYIRLSEEGLVYAKNSSGTYILLEHETYDVLEQKYGTDDADFPEAFALVGDTMYLFPTPDAVYDLRAFMYVADETIDNLAAASTNLWLTKASVPLTYLAGQRLAEFKQNKAMAQQLERHFEKSYFELQKHETANEVAARNMQRRD